MKLTVHTININDKVDDSSETIETLTIFNQNMKIQTVESQFWQFLLSYLVNLQLISLL